MTGDKNLTRQTSGLCFARGWEINNGLVYIAYSVDDVSDLIRSLGAIIKTSPASYKAQFELIKANLENIRGMLIIQGSHKKTAAVLHSLILGISLLL